MFIPLPYILYKHKKKLQNKLEDAQLPVLYKEEIEKIYTSAGVYTKYYKLQKDTLYIKVLDPIFLVELEARKKDIIKELNNKRTKPISTIRFLT